MQTEGRKAGVLLELQVAQVAERVQVQEMSWKWQIIRNLNLHMKAMESDRRVLNCGGKPLWL